MTSPTDKLAKFGVTAGASALITLWLCMWVATTKAAWLLLWAHPAAVVDPAADALAALWLLAALRYPLGWAGYTAGLHLKLLTQETT